MLIVIIYFDFIIGNSYYLFKDIGSDSINISLPQLRYLTKYLQTDGFPKWSFAQGMGQNIIPNVSDPFNWIAVAFGTNNIEYGFIWMEVVKIILTTTFIYLFFRELEFSYVARFIGTMLYTFCSFMLIGSGWMIFSTEACFLALMLLGFETLYQKNNWFIFPIAVALMTMQQPFDLYLYGLFLVIYFLFFSRPKQAMIQV